MNRFIGKITGNGGATMIEIISVLVIIGILAAFAVVRMLDSKTADYASQVEVVKGHLRYAQVRAMNTDSDWGINFNSDKTSYYLFQEGASNTTPVLIAGEGSNTVNLALKKSSLTITSAPQRITFDKYGSPGTANITVTTSASSPYNSFTVTKNTGYIFP